MQTMPATTILGATDLESIKAKNGCLLRLHPFVADEGTLRLPDGPFTIGRDDTCDLVIADADVSRRHCELEPGIGGWVLTDLDSTNGTKVNADLVLTAVLQGGERIRVGGQVFKFLADGDVEAEYHEAVYAKMTRDGLTGVHNRAYFNEVLEREVERAHRGSDATLLMFDIDHFKSVNDTHGHLAGDEILQQVAERIQSVLRKDAVFARYGGEEFAVILPDPTEALPVAERCREVIADKPFPTSNGPLGVTISVGVAVGRRADLTAEGLVQEADGRLYDAKRGGRNCVVGPASA